MVRSILLKGVSFGRTSGFVVSLLGLPGLGCAEITYGSPQTHDTLLRATPKVAPGVHVRAQISQSGTDVQLDATETCDLVEMNEIRRTTKRERQNDSLGMAITLLSIGASVASVGVLMLADSNRVYPADRNARLYNSIGSEGAIVAGTIVTSLGGLLMAVPVVDGFRSLGALEGEAVVQEKGPVLQSHVPCRGPVPPAARRAATGRIAERKIALGETDASGRLIVDLVRMVPPDIFLQPNPPSSLELWIDQTRVGDVDLGPVVEAQALEAQAAVEEACQ